MSVMRVLSLCALVFAAGCASSGGGDPVTEENAVIHQATEADIAATKRKEPITTSAAVLYVNGLGCPLCATNVDKQLLRLTGVKTATVDLAAGTVTIGLAGDRRPSPARIGSAVEDAGFTLVKIETR